MSEDRSKGKRLIPIPEALLNGLMQASSKEGKPLNRYVEDALRQAVRVFKAGQDLAGMVRYFEILQSQKASGAVFTPLIVFDFLIKEAYTTDKEKLMSVWFESGKWYGKYLTEKFANPVQSLADLLKAARWDLNEVDVKEIDGKIKFRCTSTALSNEGTELLLEFIEGALTGMDYKTVKSEFMKGLVIIEFVLCTQ